MRLLSNLGIMRYMITWVTGGFFLGFFVTEEVCNWWLVPKWAEEYPHDGQLGLGVAMYSFIGGIAGAVAGYVVRRILNDNASED